VDDEARAHGGAITSFMGQTGSGKTVAYGLAIATTLLGEAEAFGAPASRWR
jgi:ATP-dependent RNA helicase DeaD